MDKCLKNTKKIISYFIWKIKNIFFHVFWHLIISLLKLWEFGLYLRKNQKNILFSFGIQDYNLIRKTYSWCWIEKFVLFLLMLELSKLLNYIKPMKPENKVYKKIGKFIIIQKFCYNTKKGIKIRKKEKDGAKMELRRDGTINTHSFSHPWPGR